MLDNCDVKERWNGVEALLQRWLDERKALIIELCALSETQRPTMPDEICEKRLTAFCETLIDYISAGHFEVYFQLLREAESYHDGSTELAGALLPKIEQSTEIAVDFNERYTQGFNAENREQIGEQLSTLAETLENRFEFEDQLIDVVHNRHREEAQA